MATKNRRRENAVQAVELNAFEGADVWQEGDERARICGYFPLSLGTPNASNVAGDDLMIVSLEIESGNYLPTHRDSNEELLVVLDGTVEVSIGHETVEMSAGECLVVPEMEPHGVRNVGETTVRVVGFFPDSELTATFEETLLPFGTAEVTIGGGQ